MQLLSSNVDYTTPELKDRLEISERSIFRYLEVFKDAGYALHKRDKKDKKDKKDKGKDKKKDKKKK